MKPVKIAWNKFANTPLTDHLAQVLDEPTLRSFVTKAQNARHPAFQLADDLFVEIPPTTWGHGDLLIYLPRRGWLVRRNYRDHWYVDMGIFRTVGDSLFGWTDLWLDVTTPEAGGQYRVLDADEFAQALREGAVSTPLAAYALANLHSLVEAMHQGQFPPPEVREAEAFAARFSGLNAPGVSVGGNQR